MSYVQSSRPRSVLADYKSVISQREQAFERKLKEFNEIQNQNMTSTKNYRAHTKETGFRQQPVSRNKTRSKSNRSKSKRHDRSRSPPKEMSGAGQSYLKYLQRNQKKGPEERSKSRSLEGSRERQRVVDPEPPTSA